MSSFMEALSELNLTISFEGKKKKIVLAKDQYYLLERTGGSIPVIKHDALIRIADNHGIRIDKTVLEFGQFHSPDNFCFIHRASAKVGDVVIDEVGEANPSNLEGAISTAYPAIMSNKRAQDRLLIRLMGLQGQVYSDSEFPSITSSKSGKAEPKEEQMIEKMTLKEAKALTVDFGSHRKEPITLDKLKKDYPKDFEWLLTKVKINSRSSEKMKKLHYGAKTLAG